MSSLFTLGHSTRPIEVFLDLLAIHQVELIGDVRTIPKSRHNPQFGEDSLRASLEAAGLGYRHLAALGGLRHARKDSTNTGWRNLSFRGYADYMQTPAFAAGLSELEELARERCTAILCSEAVPWRCHRSLIADALVQRGWTVLDILSASPAKPHRVTPFLHVEDGVLSYPEPSPGSGSSVGNGIA